MIEVSVADSAWGIEPEDLDKIFAPFFTTKEVGKGTGLGLTVVHGIVQEHAGQIAVESEAGKGTAFRIRQPIAASTDVKLVGAVKASDLQHSLHLRGGSSYQIAGNFYV